MNFIETAKWDFSIFK